MWQEPRPWESAAMAARSPHGPPATPPQGAVWSGGGKKGWVASVWGLVVHKAAKPGLLGHSSGGGMNRVSPREPMKSSAWRREHSKRPMQPHADAIAREEEVMQAETQGSKGKKGWSRVHFPDKASEKEE